MKKKKRNELIASAKKLETQNQKKRQDPRYRRALQWLGYTGLLHHNQIMPKNVKIRFGDLEFAAEVEPRVRELMPAVISLGNRLPFPLSEVSPELQQIVVSQCKGDMNLPDYRGIPAGRYLQWFTAPVLELAEKRLSPRKAPRNRRNRYEDRGEISIGSLVKRARLTMGFTQRDFSLTFGTSLRALRDLEQGALHVTIERANAILAPFKKQLVVSAKRSQ